MKRFREIIQDNTAPSTSDLWITGGKLKYFDGGWKDLGGSEQIPWDDIQGKPEFAVVATTGSYNDLSNKPAIPAAQVNSDWNAASGVSQILNKPTLAIVATSGSYNDLNDKPSIPAAYVLPAATLAALGGVKMGTAVADTDATETATAQTVATTLNLLLAVLRACGVLTA